MPDVSPRLAARRRAVHAACRELGIDEATRRGMLQSVAGVRSTTALSLEACDRVLDHLRRAGAALKPPQRGLGQHPDVPDMSGPHGPQLGKIEALLADMRLPWKYAHAIARQMFRRQRLEWLNPAELRAVITALVIEQRKRDLTPMPKGCDWKPRGHKP